MKNRILINPIFGFLVISVTIFATTAIAQPRIPDISGIQEVSIQIACKLTLIQGNKALLVIDGDKDELDEVEVKLIGNKLKIYSDDHHQNKKDISITITLPELKSLSIEGAVDIVTPATLNYNDLTIDVSGVADFEFKLKSRTLTLDASGVLSGSILGETEDFNIEVSGVGKLDATKFKANNCKVDVSGVARVYIYAVDHLDASISGMGKIQYLGDPVIRSNSSGIGKVKNL